MTRTDSVVVGTLVALLAILAALIGVPSMQIAATPIAPTARPVPSATLAPGTSLRLGQPVSLDEATDSADFQVLIPEALGTPDAVYATLFVGLLDSENRTMHYVNAGHNPQCLLRVAGGLERMEATGMPIGLLAGHGYDERRVELSAGDLLFFYTDGCVEAESPTGEMFGAARLESLLTAGPHETGAETLARLEEAIARFRGGREASDDATLMVVNVG